MINHITQRFNAAAKKLILLDYDGTLVDFECNPQNALPSAQVLSVLAGLLNISDTEVFIITGRSQADMDIIFKELPINIIAEHGSKIKKYGIWEVESEDDGLWKKSITRIFKEIALSCPGAFIEEKMFSVTWNYRSSDQMIGNMQSRKLIKRLQENADCRSLRIIDGNKIVEVMNDKINKGIAVNKLLANNYYDYILSIGDDQTDEDMFNSLLNIKFADTIKVGEGETLARYALKSYREVVTLLEELVMSIK